MRKLAIAALIVLAAAIAGPATAAAQSFSPFSATP